MSPDDRGQLLRHLDQQARFLAALTAWASDNPQDHDILVRARDEVFTLRETLENLEVPYAAVSNSEWNAVPHMGDRPDWPRADQLPD